MQRTGKRLALGRWLNWSKRGWGENGQYLNKDNRGWLVRRGRNKIALGIGWKKQERWHGRQRATFSFICPLLVHHEGKWRTMLMRLHNNHCSLMLMPALSCHQGLHRIPHLHSCTSELQPLLKHGGRVI